jgi:hypothetical protein
MDTEPEVARLLGEQIAYYRALAPDYLDQVLDLPGGDFTDVLDAFAPTGSVLELACGPGMWTSQLASRPSLRRGVLRFLALPRPGRAI